MAEKFSTEDANLRAAAIKTGYANGVIGIFNGTQPATANDSEGAATLLALITLNSGTFTAGVATNGINLSDPVDGVLSKASGETWSGLGLAAAGELGTDATWFRHYPNGYVTGASTTSPRYDGAVGTVSTYELQISNTKIVTGIPVIITGYTRTIKRTA